MATIFWTTNFHVKNSQNFFSLIRLNILRLVTVQRVLHSLVIKRWWRTPDDVVVYMLYNRDRFIVTKVPRLRPHRRSLSLCPSLQVRERLGFLYRKWIQHCKDYNNTTLTLPTFQKNKVCNCQFTCMCNFTKVLFLSLAE